MHSGVACLASVLAQTWCANHGGIHDGDRVHLEAASLQRFANLGKQGSAQLVVVEQLERLRHGCGVRHPLRPQVDANKAAQVGTIDR